MADRGFSPDYSESTEIGRIMVSGAITEPKQLITKEYMEANAVAGAKGEPGIPGIPGTDGADGGSAVIQGSATAAAIIAKPHAIAHMWIATTTGTDSDGHAIAVGDGVVSDGAKWLTVGPIQGPKGDTGAAGTSAPSSHPLLTDRGAADAHPYTAITDVERVFTDRLKGFLTTGKNEQLTGNIDLLRSASTYLIATLGTTGTFPPGYNLAKEAAIETVARTGNYGLQYFYTEDKMWVRRLEPSSVGAWNQIGEWADLSAHINKAADAHPLTAITGLSAVLAKITALTTQLAGFTFVQITQAAYTALATKDPKTIYLIVG